MRQFQFSSCLFLKCLEKLQSWSIDVNESNESVKANINIDLSWKLGKDCKTDHEQHVSFLL